jgi:death on curing protein
MDRRLVRVDAPFAPPQAEATAIILALAAGQMSNESLARWMRARWPKRA